MLVYSGTDDGVMPTEGTRGWLEALGLPPGNAFRAWTDRGAWPGEVRACAGWACILRGLAGPGAGRSQGQAWPPPPSARARPHKQRPSACPTRRTHAPAPPPSRPLLVQTSGMLEQYRGNQVTLATVLGAGHSAPYFKPVKVQQLARSFVTGTPF